MVDTKWWRIASFAVDMRYCDWLHTVTLVSSWKKKTLPSHCTCSIMFVMLILTVSFTHVWNWFIEPHWQSFALKKNYLLDCKTGEDEGEAWWIQCVVHLPFDKWNWDHTCFESTKWRCSFETLHKGVPMLLTCILFHPNKWSCNLMLLPCLVIPSILSLVLACSLLTKTPCRALIEQQPIDWLWASMAGGRKNAFFNAEQTKN